LSYVKCINQTQNTHKTHTTLPGKSSPSTYNGKGARKKQVLHDYKGKILARLIYYL
jgi:hypothetical protein